MEACSQSLRPHHSDQQGHNVAICRSSDWTSPKSCKPVTLCISWPMRVASVELFSGTHESVVSRVSVTVMYFFPFATVPKLTSAALWLRFVPLQEWNWYSPVRNVGHLWPHKLQWSWKFVQLLGSGPLEIEVARAYLRVLRIQVCNVCHLSYLRVE